MYIHIFVSKIVKKGEKGKKNKKKEKKELTREEVCGILNAFQKREREEMIFEN